MTLVQPFRALRPAPGRAAEVLAPPYDVLSSDEARVRAHGRPWSFLHVSRPEIDLDPAIDPHDPAVYAKARENLDRMVAEGVLIRDTLPSFYVYRLTWRDRVQTGLALTASVAAYESGRIRKHELTTPAKEDDRVHQIEAVNAQTGPVMLAYRDAPGLDTLLAQVTETERAVDVTADDGVRHEMWVVDGPETVSQLGRMVDALPVLYIADGHHRSAAATRVAAARGGAGSHGWFLAVMFPDHQMTILDYNRLMKDLNGHSPAALLAALGERFEVRLADGPVRPAAASEFGLFVDGAWYALTLHPERVPADDPVGRLPITLLSRNAIEPLFGITDQRRDKRIDFVGGGRGVEELARRVTAGEAAAAFSLFPTPMADLMAVADAGEIMPPKSTWFEPKLADGMVSHVLD
ncbi:hypothetical protein RHODGE_RHODGE_03481 [Rhodoplanes serenus]|uniref:DUF1015 domain-containing protein n=1 Tax=Rhodoplanes serenus TaxID=200615 RepID=A0A3S4B2W2_9BRAD|nr:DUF1015 family protein [Rhodoplanes serenus]VCU10293.1 hypothetical protein RHODGE_RHODGE_03481 [Rhodoplanes serenus]